VYVYNIIIRCFLLINHTVYSYNFTAVQTLFCFIDCSIKVYWSFSLTCNLTGKDSQYTEIILPIMLFDAFRYQIDVQ